MRSDYCTFRLAQLIHVVVYQAGRQAGVFHHRPASYAQKAKSKFSLIKNPRDRHVHNSLSNVVIHMPCVNIHRAGHYQLKMVFLQLDARLPDSDRNG